MRAIGTVQSFWRRRVSVPVGRDALVLDVGSGEHPHWRSDVLVDRYVGADSANQRYRGGEVKLTRPLFNCDAADLPFADDAFDYSICSHVLEHVPNPVAVVSELGRVSRAGLIEVPAAGSSKIIDFPSHLWFCSTEGATLRFVAKRAKSFDPQIEEFLVSSGLDRSISRLFARSFDACVVHLRWQGTAHAEVDGEPDLSLMTAGGTIGHPVGGAGLMTNVESVLRRTLGPRSRALHWNDIVSMDHYRPDNPRLEPQIYSV